MTHLRPLAAFAPLTARTIAAAFAERQAAFIANMADAMAHLVRAGGFAGRAQLVRQGFAPDDLDRWGLTAWCKAVGDHGIDPRMTDCCATGVLTGTPPFRLRQWLRHVDTGRTGTVIAQTPHAAPHAASTGPWLVTIKTAAGPLSGPGAAFVGE